MRGLRTVAPWLAIVAAIAMGGCVQSYTARGGPRYITTPAGGDVAGAATIGTGFFFVNATASVESEASDVAALFGLELDFPGSIMEDNSPWGTRFGAELGADYDGGRAAAVLGGSLAFMSWRSEKRTSEETEWTSTILAIGVEVMAGGRFSSDDDGFVGGLGIVLEYHRVVETEPKLGDFGSHD